MAIEKLNLCFLQDSAGSESWDSYLGDIFCNTLKESSLHVKIVEKLPSSFPTFVVDVSMFNDDGESANLKEWILNRLLLEVKKLPTSFGEFDQEFLSAEVLNPFCEGYAGHSKFAEVENVEPAVPVNLLDKSDDEKINNLNFSFNKLSVKCLPNVKTTEDVPSPKTNLLEISSSEEISSSSGLSIDSKAETNSSKSSSTSNSSSVENNLSWPTEVFKPIHPAQPIPVMLTRHVSPQPVFNPNFYPPTPRSSAYPPSAYYPPPPQFPPRNVPVHAGMPHFRPPYHVYQGNSLQQGLPMPMYSPPNWNPSLNPAAGLLPWSQNSQPPPVSKASKTISSASLLTENQTLQFKGPDSKKNISSSNNTNARLNVLSQEFVPVNGNASHFNDLNPKDQKIAPMSGVSQHSENHNLPNVSEHSNSNDTPVLPSKGEIMYRSFKLDNSTI